MSDAWGSSHEHAGFAGGSALLKSDVRDLRDDAGAFEPYPWRRFSGCG